MVFKLKVNGKCITFLREFLTKIFFISKHFNYNIHFLNIVSVRWHPLLSTHSRKCFWNFCTTCCSMLWEIGATSSEVFCFKSTVVLRSFLYIFLFRYPQRKKLQALRSGDLASHSLFPLREIAQGGNVSWRTRNVSHCIILVKPDALGFNIKSPQLQFQKMCIMSQCSGLNLLLLPC